LQQVIVRSGRPRTVQRFETVEEDRTVRRGGRPTVLAVGGHGTPAGFGHFGDQGRYSVQLARAAE